MTMDILYGFYCHWALDRFNPSMSNAFYPYRESAPVGLTASAMVRIFLESELGLLYSRIANVQEKKLFQTDGQFPIYGKFVNAYLTEFTTFRGTYKQSVVLLFRILCWVRSVQMLEDSSTLFMSQTIYQCRYYQKKRCWNYEQYKDKLLAMGSVMTCKGREMLFSTGTGTEAKISAISDSLDMQFEELRKVRSLDWDADSLNGSFLGVRTNSFLAGCYLLDGIYMDHDCCCRLVEIFTEYRMICFFYMSCKDNGLISEIPFLETFISMFKKKLFYNPQNSEIKTQKTRSEYFNCYYMSCGYSLKDLALLKENAHSDIFVQKEYYKEKMCMSPASASRLILEDFSSENSSEVLSTKDYLNAVSEVTNLDFAFLSVDLLMFFIPFYRFFDMLRLVITVQTE
jgi:hypothetical protein